jgi:galactose mutarotase-like enzyme
MQPRVIEKNNNKLIVNPHGSRIEELTLEGQKIFTKITRGDDKEGSSHPCIPQFGPDTLNYGIPQHGSARNKDFKLLNSSSNIELSQNIEDGEYPKGLNINQKHSLIDQGYSLITTVSNNSDQELPVNFAEHFYWHVPNDWEGLKVNGVNVADVVKKDASISLKSKNIIEIPGQRPIILTQAGFSIFRLWAYKNMQAGKYDQNYVCIEPAEGDPEKNFFGSKKSMIKPHESRTIKITIKLDE